MFEIEKMESEFDYSLVDNDTADFLRSCEYEINGIAEDARVKFGKVLVKAREKLANHHGGVFQKWYESGGLDKHNVYYYMDLYESSRNLENSKRENFLKAPKTVQKKVMQKNTPEEIKEAVHQGEVTTNKQLVEMERKLKEWDEKLKQRDSQLESTQRENELLHNKLEQAENVQPEVVEKEVIKEVVPEDIKRQVEEYKAKVARESKSAESLRNELKKYTEAFSDPQQAYDEKEERRLERDSNINAYKLAIGIQKFIESNAVETYKVSSVIRSDEAAKRRLLEHVELLKDFTDQLESILNARIITK